MDPTIERVPMTVKAPLPAQPHPLTDLSVLDGFLAGAVPPGSDPNRRLFYSPVDNVHGALHYVLASAQRSLIVCMYGFDDPDLADILSQKLALPSVYVQLTLDSSQAGGVHEKALLAQEGYPNSSIAIGRSEKGAIMHLKTAVVDASIVVHGSTNWSAGGESLQDNELLVSIDPTEAAVVTTRIAAIHTNILSKVKGSPMPTEDEVAAQKAAEEAALTEEGGTVDEQAEAPEAVEVILVHTPGGGTLPKSGPPSINADGVLSTHGDGGFFDAGQWLYAAVAGTENPETGMTVNVNYSDPQQPGTALSVGFAGTDSLAGDVLEISSGGKVIAWFAKDSGYVAVTEAASEEAPTEGEQPDA